MWRRRLAMAIGGGLLLATGAADGPGTTERPRSPMATDALRLESAAIRDATHAYWAACAKADSHLANVLQTAAHAAHDRNDGAEERACDAAASDARSRSMSAGTAASGNAAAGPLPPFRFEKSR